MKKIIHDCRMDSDALWHLLHIRLQNVHDTSCWHFSISGREDQNLNSTLMYYGLQPNAERDKSVYDRNNAFWATRPLTSHMIEWASGDVSSMVGLYAAQLSRAGLRAGDHISERARLLSLDALEKARSANVAKIFVRNPGRFIGAKGVNLRSLQQRTNTKLYSFGNKGTGNFIVFYHDSAGLQEVQRAASN